MSRYGDCKVYVGDLGNNASKPELEDAFSYYGPLRNVWVARNPPGFAFVEFEDARDAEDAVSSLTLAKRICKLKCDILIIELVLTDTRVRWADDMRPASSGRNVERGSWLWRTWTTSSFQTPTSSL